MSSKSYHYIIPMADILGEKKKTSITSLNKNSKVYVYNVVTKEWRSRTCELNGSYLSFYRKEKIVAVIDLEQVGDISPVTDIPEDDILKDTVFTISLKEDRNFMIRTISSEECISWISILQEVRDKLRSQLSRKSNVSVTSSSHNTFDRLMSSDDHAPAIDNGSSDKIEDYFDNEGKLDGNILSPIPISQENSTVGVKHKPAAGSVVNNIKKRFSFGTALSNTFSTNSVASPNNLISSPQARRVSFSFPMTNKQLIPPPSSSSSSSSSGISKFKVKCNESVLHVSSNNNNATNATASNAKADGPNGKDYITMLVPSNPPLDNDSQKAIMSVQSPVDSKKRSDATRNIVVDENKENMHLNTQPEEKSPSAVVSLMSPKKKLLLNESVEVTPTHFSTVVNHQEGSEVHATVASISTSPMNASCIDASHRLMAPRVNVNTRAPNYRTPERKSSFVNRTSLGTQTPNFRRPLKAPYQSYFDVWTSSVPLSYVIMMVFVAVLVGSFISSCYIIQHYEIAIRNGQLITARNTASTTTTINLLPTIQPSEVSSSMDHCHNACEAKPKVDFENNSPFARNVRQVIQAKSSSLSPSSSTTIKCSSAFTSLDTADIGSSSALDQLVSGQRAEVVTQNFKSSTSPLQVLFQVLRESFRLLTGIKGRIVSFFCIK